MHDIIPSLIYTSFLAVGLIIGFAFYFFDIYFLQKRVEKINKEILIALNVLNAFLKEGYPLEKAITLARRRLEGLEIENFFNIVIRELESNKPLEEAIEKALDYYPSPLVKGIFEIIISNVYKGTLIITNLVESLANYLGKVHSALERMKDLLSESISEMKLQINMLIPIMLGIIVGIGGFMIAMMVLITKIMKQFQGIGNANLQGININIPLDVLQMFMIKKETITPFLYQILVGLYVIISVIILSYTLNMIENSNDPIKEKIIISKNLAMSFFFYAIIVVGVVILFAGLYEMLRLALTS